MSVLAMWLGYVVLGLAGAVAIWLAFELGVGIVASISWHRWRLTARLPGWRWRKHGHQVVISTLRMAVTDFWGYRNNGDTKYSGQGGGYWHGIGDWRANTNATTEYHA